MITPAIVFKTQFTAPISKGASFEKFIEYIDRKETHQNENDYAGYQDYMANDEKSTGLFTNDKDNLSEEEKINAKEIIRKAQENKSVLWQDVISFDNDWLKEIGVLKINSNGSQFIDEVKLKQATRNAINAMWKNEGIEDSIYWTASIHYNTDNIHVHVASVQTRDVRFRGKRKQASLDKAKSAGINTLLDRSKENEKLNDFIRNKVVESKKHHQVMSFKNKIMNPEMVKQFKKIHSMLPQDDKRKWSYNMNSMASVRPELDKLTDMYLDKYFREEFKEFKSQLDKEVDVYKKAYGDTEKAYKYRDTKLKDLYTRTGNTILKELKEYDKQLQEMQRLKAYQSNRGTKNLLENKAAHQLMYRINRGMHDDLQHYKNQREFEKLQYEQEMNR